MTFQGSLTTPIKKTQNKTPALLNRPGYNKSELKCGNIMPFLTQTTARQAM